MARPFAIVLALTLLPMFGCNDDKIAQLQKQNEDLKAQMAKQSAATDFDLQAKCSTAAKLWFNENWSSTSREKATIFLDHSNHYSKASNQCMILVEYHAQQPDKVSWSDSQTLWNVFENSKDGELLESNFISFIPNHDGSNSSKDTVITCEVYGSKCADSAGFNKLVEPYMNN